MLGGDGPQKRSRDASHLPYAAPMNFSSLRGTVGVLQGKRGKALALAVIMAVTATLAHADDMAEMISRYRREHGLSTVKTDPQLTAVAERQAKAMAAPRLMEHNVGRALRAPVSPGEAEKGAGKNAARAQS